MLFSVLAMQELPSASYLRMIDFFPLFLLFCIVVFDNDYIVANRTLLIEGLQSEDNVIEIVTVTSITDDVTDVSTCILFFFCWLNMIFNVVQVFYNNYNTCFGDIVII